MGDARIAVCEVVSLLTLARIEPGVGYVILAPKPADES